MRALTQDVDRTVAVPAEHAVSRWELLLAQASVLLRAAPVAFGPALGSTISIDVINRQEGDLCCLTASTLASVGVNDFGLEFVAVAFLDGSGCFCVRCIPSCSIGVVCLSRGMWHRRIVAQPDDKPLVIKDRVYKVVR